MFSPYLFLNTGCVYKLGLGALLVPQNVITNSMMIVTLILLLILVCFEFHARISCHHDANLGVHSSCFVTKTITNTNSNTDINRNTSIRTRMDILNAIRLAASNKLQL